MNTRLANPYVVGAPLSTNQGFYGREDVFRFIYDTFAVPAQNVIVLYGQRRIGKTSLLHQLATRMGEGYHAVLFDLQGRGQHDLPELLHGLSGAIARSLKLAPPDSAAFDAGRDALRETLLPQVHAALNPRQRLLILFDEFDVMGDEPSTPDDLAGSHLFGYLRNWLVNDPRLACVFVIGRRLDELPVHYRALFKQAVFRRLSMMPRQEAVELITRPVAGVLDYAPDAVDAILNLTAGHPYLTQLVCHVLYKRLMTMGRYVVNAADVSDCLDEAMEIGSGGLDWFWEGLPRAERLMLSALAEAIQTTQPEAPRSNGNGKSNLSAREEDMLQTLSRHRVRLLGVELTTARQRLLEWEILAREGDHYRFTIDLVRRWVAREHSLDRAQEDIDLISQRATRYFNNARDAHLAGDLPLAIEDYRRALAANPHHFGARLGLAQSLQESGDLPNAIGEYEKACQIDPSSARDGLVSARLALGIQHQTQGNLDAAIGEFDRVLRLAPSDDEAQSRLISIWVQRGETELAANHYAPGVEAFARALALAPEDESLQTRVKSIVRRFSEFAEARGAWEVAFESVARLAEYLPKDEQIQGWLSETRLHWRAHNYYEMARRARSAGDSVTAMEECRRALDANPNHVQARVLLAAMLYQSGDLTGAIQEYELAYRVDPAATDPGLAQARLQRAVELESRGDLVTAAVDYERALEVQPTSDTARRRLPAIYMRWGDDHLAAGRLDEAVGAFRKALLVAAQPQTLARPIKTKFAEFSQAERTAGRWDTAIAAIVRLRTDLMLRDRETDGWLLDLWLARGAMTLEAGQYKESAAPFKQALQLAAEASTAGSILTRIKDSFFSHAESRLQATQADAAIAALAVLIEIVGGDVDTFGAMARAWLARGDHEFKFDHLDEAEDAFHRALELRHDYPEALSRLTAVADRRKRLLVDRLRAEARSYAERRAWAQAESIYRQLIFEYHDTASQQAFAEAGEAMRLEDLYKLAQAYHSEGNWDAAIPVWIEICHSRRDYVGRDGQKAELFLAEAIERSAGIAQKNERALARLKQRARTAWIVAGALGMLAAGGLLFALANGLLKIP
ncbi:MAG TPA: tetratricopeptide repeat protein [Anaerolineae bacterium]